MRIGEVEQFAEKYRASGIGLAMEDLSYTYHTGTEVFSKASLEAWPHEIIALVGPSGEGKTTMLRLILSCCVPRGEAWIGAGEDREQRIALSPSTRKLFSYVPQGNTMFSGTIAENMRNVKPEATDEEIVEALKLACAWEFVEKLPDGIESMVKERGGGFSEGQAQRLSIARALLRKSPILLLDEATSALDVATERKVLKNIMTDTYPRTCIVTTHRPTVLGICTRVYAIRGKKCGGAGRERNFGDGEGFLKLKKVAELKVPAKFGAEFVKTGYKRIKNGMPKGIPFLEYGSDPLIGNAYSSNCKTCIGSNNQVTETDIIGWILMISQFYFQCSGFVTGNKSCAARNISNILVETDSQNLGFLGMISIMLSIYLNTVIATSVFWSLVNICRCSITSTCRINTFSHSFIQRNYRFYIFTHFLHPSAAILVALPEPYLSNEAKRYGSHTWFIFSSLSSQIQ